MTAQVERVYEAVLALTAPERDELMRELLAASPVLLSPDWQAEVDHRSDEIDAGTATLIPWETVRDQARRDILGRG